MPSIDTILKESESVLPKSSTKGNSDLIPLVNGSSHDYFYVSKSSCSLLPSIPSIVGRSSTSISTSILTSG